MSSMQAMTSGQCTARLRAHDLTDASFRRRTWARAVQRMATRCMQQRCTPSTPREVWFPPLNDVIVTQVACFPEASLACTHLAYI